MEGWVGRAEVRAWRRDMGSGDCKGEGEVEWSRTALSVAQGEVGLGPHRVWRILSHLSAGLSARLKEKR